MVIQNNFEFPPYAVLGNLDASNAGGHTRFVTALNAEFARATSSRSKLLIQNVCSLSARIGLNHWFDPNRYFSYKVVTTSEGSAALATSLAAMVRAMYGKTRKALVLDLDNTLWGGVIGDDGVDRIQIGSPCLMPWPSMLTKSESPPCAGTIWQPRRMPWSASTIAILGSNA